MGMPTETQASKDNVNSPAITSNDIFVCAVDCNL